MNKLFRFYFIPTEFGCPGSFSCNECNDHLSEVGLPGSGLAPDWFMNGKQVWFHRNDTSVRCKGFDPDTDCDLRVCLLELPSTKQINRCLDPQPINPLYYNQTCLQNSIDCPNCDKVQGYLESLDFEPDPHSPTGLERYMTRASVYEPFKRSIEEFVEQNLVPHWTWTGCFYFALTILTTIGYGNFAPATVPSKIVRDHTTRCRSCPFFTPDPATHHHAPHHETR